MSADSSRSNLYAALFIPALILGALIIVAILVISFRSDSEPRNTANNENGRRLDASTMAKFATTYDALGEAAGSADAPVTIREFGDYQCPACGAFAPTATRIRNNLVKSGKARFVFFDFPLKMHAHAQEAAEAARCAARQDKFWPYHERLYATQRQWAEKPDPTAAFLDMAVETGVNADRLKRCIAQGAPDDIISRSRKAGRAIGLRATPTVIVGNTLFSGGVGYDKIREEVARQSDG